MRTRRGKNATLNQITQMLADIANGMCFMEEASARVCFCVWVNRKYIVVGHRKYIVVGRPPMARASRRGFGVRLMCTEHLTVRADDGGVSG